jgi:hypothetical protein
MAEQKVKISDLVTEYHLRGEILYGKKPDGSRASAGERAKAKKVRRIIEGVVPDVRSREKQMFSGVLRARSFPIPRLTVELVPGTQAGKISYPDGSWRNYTVIEFSDTRSMRDAVARLIVRGIIDVDSTQAIIAGSARPLLTLMAD